MNATTRASGFFLAEALGVWSSLIWQWRSSDTTQALLRAWYVRKIWWLINYGLDRPRSVVVACPPMKSNVNLVRTKNILLSLNIYTVWLVRYCSHIKLLWRQRINCLVGYCFFVVFADLSSRSGNPAAWIQPCCQDNAKWRNWWQGREWLPSRHD